MPRAPLKTSSVIILGILVALLSWRPTISHGATPSFTATNLTNITLDNPTSLQFGPDGRLYVSQQNGLIRAFTIQRNSATQYTATATETITLVKNIPNRNDDGTLNTAMIDRQVTGILVTGTAANPVLYVSSSDPRIAVGADSNLDTNSGVISRLTKNGSTWTKVDLVRGLPRNEENHSPNGLTLDPVQNILYLAQGGHTNMGAPSNSFAFQPEYALSAAILSIDLDMINAMPPKVDSFGQTYLYDLPTLDDPGRPNGPDGRDINDPFGGNNGANQAVIIAGGPVQVFSSGYRNPYDFVITEAGRMYTVDNGSNHGWGGLPIGDGTPNCTNGANEAGTASHPDNLHFIVGPGAYSGHPSPTRGNIANIFNGQSPILASDGQQCDYRTPGIEDGALAVFANSTNGLAEYTASNFDDEMTGNLLTASFDGSIYRIVLSSNGQSALSTTPLFSGFGSTPLDVIARGDGDIFPGTVWVANYGSDSITVFEPADFGTCTGADNPALDEDQDGYDNADEIDNGTDPCSAASRPTDNDGDSTSDLNDPDDDNDGRPDLTDPFQIDAANGRNTSIPLDYGWAIGQPGFGFFSLGFTGFMTNGSSDYITLFDSQNLTAGGAAGKLTIDNVPSGDAFGNINTQDYGFQFGVDIDDSTTPFTVHTRVEPPYFNGQTPQGEQALGLFIGQGNQDNYLGLRLHANNGAGGLQIVHEVNGGPQTQMISVANLLASTSIDLYLSVNPLTGLVQPRYSINGGSPTSVGTPINVPLAWLNGADGLAVGLLSTSRNGTPFAATWDGIDITFDSTSSTGQWTSVPQANFHPTSHENGFIEVGGKFYLLGGRGIQNVHIFNPATSQWSVGAALPMELHHIQAVELDGLIYIVGAMSGACCSSEFGIDRVLIYDPIADDWHDGPIIPQGRRRGAGGTVVYNDKIYLAGGLTGGHGTAGTSFALFDVYDPAANTWTALPNAPRVRDHYAAVVIGDRLYAAGGRNSSMANFFDATIGPVDVFDFNSGQWSTLPSSTDIPTQRGGTSAVALGNEVLVIGGEGHGTAHANTEALNVTTNTWRSLAPLLQARHGTQATICNGGVYIANGSGGQGGGPELNTQEVFFLNTPTSCTAPAVTPGTLGSSPTQVNFGTVAVGSSTTQSITLSNTGGNQAILIQGFSTSNGVFTVTSPTNLPRHLEPGETLVVEIAFAPTNGQTFNATLTVNHSRMASAPLTIPLTGTGTGAAITPTATPPSGGQALYRVNAGGAAVAAGDGSQPTWSADISGQPSPFSNQPAGGSGTFGTAATIDLSHPSVPASATMALFQSERFDTAGGSPMVWSFPVQAGSYQVRLYFAEIYTGITGPGQRVFDVAIEGNVVLDNYDVFAQSGGLNKAIVETFTVSSDATLTISFAHVVENPAIKAIEIVPAGGAASPTPTITPSPTVSPTTTPTLTPSPTTTPPSGGQAQYRVNAGGAAVAAGDGTQPTWSADTSGQPSPFSNHATSGSLTFGTAATIDLSHPSVPSSATMALFQSERWDPAGGSPMVWSFPVQAGSYQVRLYFAEIYSGITGPGQRVFDVSIEDTQVLDNYDVFANSGGLNKAIVETFTVSSDATLTISFAGIVQNPAVKAIEILPVGGAPSQTPTVTPSPAVSPTMTPTLTPTPTVTPSLTVSPTMTLTPSPTATAPSGGQAQYRVNAGGAAVAAGDGSQPTWSADTSSQPSPFSNQPAGGSGTFGTAATIDLSHPSVPASATMALFQSERWDPAGGSPMVWSFPVQAGNYQVRLYFAEIYTGITGPGQRVFDVAIEGNIVLDNYDVFAQSGGLNKAIVEAFTISSDATLTISFAHVTENPAIKAIEIMPAGGAAGPTPTVTPSPTVSPTTTPTLTPTPTASVSQTPTVTPSPTVSPTTTPTLTPTPTATAGSVPTVTNTATTVPSSTLTPTNTPTAAPDLIFADGFESGMLNGWSASTTDGDDLSVNTNAALVGSFGLRAIIDSNPAIFVTDNSPVAEQRYRARFYFDPNSISMGNNSAFTILAGFNSAGIQVVRLEIRFASSIYQLRGTLLNDGSTELATSWVTLSDAVHIIEMDWQAATSAGTSDGSLTLWLDDVQQAAVTGVDSDTRRIDQVRLGVVSGVNGRTRGTVFFDAFESRRQSYMGPVAGSSVMALGLAAVDETSVPTPSATVMGPQSLISEPLTSEPAMPTVIVLPEQPNGTGHWEAEGDTVERSAGWVLYNTPPGASGSGYLINTDPADSLTITFMGSAIDVVYVRQQSFGSFALELDGEIAQVVDGSIEAQFIFGTATRLDGLTPGVHRLRILPQGSVVAVDSFVVHASEPQVATDGAPTVTPTVTASHVTPTATATPVPVLSLTPTATVVTATSSATPVLMQLPIHESMDDGAPHWSAVGGWRLEVDAAFGANGLGWEATSESGPGVLLWNLPIDLRSARQPVVQLQSRLSAQAGMALLEATVDGLNWFTVTQIQPTAAWQLVEAPLSAWAGQVVQLRFVWQPAERADDTAESEIWQLDELIVVDQALLPTVKPSMTPTVVPAVESVTDGPTLAPTDASATATQSATPEPGTSEPTTATQTASAIPSATATVAPVPTDNPTPVPPPEPTSAPMPAPAVEETEPVASA